MERKEVRLCFAKYQVSDKCKDEHAYRERDWSSPGGQGRVELRSPLFIADSFWQEAGGVTLATG